MSAARTPRATRMVAGTGCRLLPAGLVLLGLALAGALGACGDTVGTNSNFKPKATTNTDFNIQTIPTGNYPQGLVVADLNGDAVDDFAVTNYLDKTVSIYLGNGSASFSVQTVAVPGFPTMIRAGNLFGGGVKDLAVITEDNLFDSLVLLRNNGTSFSAEPPVALGTIAEQMDVTCIRTACSSSTAQDVVMSLTQLQLVRVFLNDGSGSFTSVDSVIGVNTGQYAIADFDGNGITDLALTLPGEDQMQIMLGQGDGTFPGGARFGTEDLPFKIVAAPLRSVGMIDLAITCYNVDRVSIYFGAGNGSFTGPISLDGIKHSDPLVVDDFNGYPAIVAGVRGKDTLAYLTSVGTGVFGLNTLDTTTDPANLISGDFVGDGSKDIVTAELNDRVMGVFAGDGSGGFTRTQIGFATQVIAPTPIHACGGSKPDLLLVQPYSDAVALLCNRN